MNTYRWTMNFIIEKTSKPRAKFGTGNNYPLVPTEKYRDFLNEALSCADCFGMGSG